MCETSQPDDQGFRARHQLYRSVSGANVPEEQSDGGHGFFGELEGFRHKAEFVFETIRGWDLPIAFALSTIVTASVRNKNLPFLSNSTAAVGTLGALYSFALVFRTNICYARWVSALEISSFILDSLPHTDLLYRLAVGAQQGRVWLKDDELRSRLSRLSIAYAYACKAQLRGNSLLDDEEDGSELTMRGIICQEELDIVAAQDSWQAYYFIDAMRAVVHEGFTKSDCDAWTKFTGRDAMEDTICTLSSSIGGCIRVKQTGLPVAYDNILYTVGYIFYAAACLAWAPGAGMYNPFLLTTVYITFKMFVGIGDDMEDPFGHDESDLPLEKFCETIETQVGAVTNRATILPYNIAYGPVLSRPRTPSESYQHEEALKTFKDQSQQPSSSTVASTIDTDDTEAGWREAHETDPLVKIGLVV
ncbi:hypothetical protein THAOC_08223 [Thalassiosira oceanica]|uniref:Bestrophin homolog n=1 Tax=Thalassiosira oceanica TaxID=159749 RepID=K0TIN8_THAOC|nr:hypothetical protein THAOC_08223 [Thalassiosira oceanica]|eukprot:EJK70422.1 hypothetical protein THAOC_08223 [Thalassiosira oceanica]